MDIKVLEDTKNEIKVEIDNLTLAEILRVYLNKDSSVESAVWNKEHPTKNPVLYVKTKGKIARKAINDAVKAVTKDLDKISSDFKKMK